MIEIKVPSFGESIQEVQVASWLKKPGEWVDKDEDLVELESEKASQCLPSPEAGILEDIKVADGQFAQVGDVLATMKAGEKPAGGAKTESVAAAGGSDAATATAVAPPAENPAANAPDARTSSEPVGFVMPAAERVLAEYQIAADQITPTGPGGRVLKEDVLKFVEANNLKPGDGSAKRTRVAPVTPVAEANEAISSLGVVREETVKPMSMMRRTIATRLVEAQQTAALLTTFNEIDMQPVMELRKKYKEPFLKKHGVKLGFMSFFAKAAVEALRRFPAVNAEIRDDSIVYRHYHDIGVAIGGGKGLVVPVLRNVEQMSFAQVEAGIGDFAKQAGENRLQPDDLIGGTFTISNGGIYGSLLSTPIVNPPQSGILGLHTIQERPFAIDGQVVIRPMMYVALTYDHRIVDGREAVGFLRTIKDVIEDPARLFLEL